MLTTFDKLKVSGVVLILTFLLSPGLLLTLPPIKGSTLGLLGFGVLNSKQTHILSMFVHALVISFLMFLILTYAPLIQTIGQSEDAVDEIVGEVEGAAETAIGADKEDEGDEGDEE